MSDLSRIESALSFVPADDRDTWLRMGMAVKSELGESGRDIWDAWSQQAESYRAESANAVWRSIKEFGRVTIASLFRAAQDHGWRDEDASDRPSAEQLTTRRQASAQRARAASVQEQAEEERAARNSAALMKGCTPSTHPYLIEKGFKDLQALVSDGALVIPMRDCINNALLGVQTVRLVDNEWQKKMIYGMRAKGAALRIGLSHCAETWLVEGYATGLSVSAALKTLRLSASVVVCFSAGNLVHVANRLGGRRFVFADNDASKTGEHAAWDTGLPYAMPPTVGHDANDWHKAAGVLSVAKAMMDVRRK